MTRQYFDLSDDVYIPGRWELGNPVDQHGRALKNPRVLRKGAPVPFVERLRIPVERSGKPLDFSLAGFSIPVLSMKLATALAAAVPDDIQLLPVEIDSQPAPYAIVNVTRLVRCIDDAACAEVQYWTPEDKRPEKIGQYRAVYGMRIDPTKAGDARIFRTWGWPVALVVSSEIKDLMEKTGATGAKFTPVSALP